MSLLDLFFKKGCVPLKPEVVAETIRGMQDEIERLKTIELPVRYVEVTRFEDADETYLRELATIGTNEHFRFFLYEIRETIIEQLEKAAPDAEGLRAQLAGELKAVNIVRALLEAKIMAYSQRAK
ncbi:hypothetical protein CCP3SC15_380027 [Gammaproteobacteria bacterium]